MVPLMKSAVQRFNDRIDRHIKKLIPRCGTREMKKYHILAMEGKFNPDLVHMAQLMIRISNKRQVERMKEQDVPLIDQSLGLNEGRHPITIILDEGDLNIQSASGEEGALERQWYEKIDSELAQASTFIESCFQVVYVTATINALAITGERPIHLLQLKPPPDYIGLARAASRQPHIEFGCTDKSDGLLSPLLERMVTSMTRDPRQQRVGLIHGEKLRMKHTSLQEELVVKFSGVKLVVMNHNSGHVSSAEDGEALAMQATGISLLATSFDQFDSLLTDYLKPKDGVKVDESGRIHFKRRRRTRGEDEEDSYALPDVMTLLAELRYRNPFTLLIISGHCGGRGITFKDRDHCQTPVSAMHLSDLYLSFPESATGEVIVQTANRISGTYPDHPVLRLWTSEADWASIKQKHDEIDAFYLVLSQNPGMAPIDALRDHGARIEAFLRGAEGGRKHKLMSTRSKVEQRVRFVTVDEDDTHEGTNEDHGFVFTENKRPRHDVTQQ